MDQISEHFSLNELTRTNTGINNDPSIEAGANLVRLCAIALEPARTLLGVPLVLHSAYRSPGVNAEVGGAANSAHVEGRAADFHPGNGMDIMLAFNTIRQSAIEYDKLIIEHKEGSWWIHIQIAKAGSKARRLAYRAAMRNGKMEYTPFS